MLPCSKTLLKSSSFPQSLSHTTTRHGSTILVQRHPTPTPTPTRIRIQTQPQPRTQFQPQPHRTARHERCRRGPPTSHRCNGVRVRVGERLRRQGYSRRLLPRLRRPRALPLGDSPREFLRGAAVPRGLLRY